MPSPLFLLGISPIVLFALWFVSSTIFPPPVPLNLHNKRIVLLIAHPDDESMFFSPALQALTEPSLGNHLKVLCMSTGNADGLGEIRKKELEAAAVTLGVRMKEDVFVMDDPRFRDGVKEQWDPKEIARVLASAFAPQLLPASSILPTVAEFKKHKKTPSVTAQSKVVKSIDSPLPVPSADVKGPGATIDILLTFDPSGVSSHPNHISLYHGSKLFLSQIMKGHSGYACPVTLYTLTSINILRKYSFVLDLVPTYIHGIISSIIENIQGGEALKRKKISQGPKGDRVVFVNTMTSYLKSRKAMVEGHKSQMVWFRWGWISLGRYMVVNDLRRDYTVGA